MSNFDAPKSRKTGERVKDAKEVPGAARKAAKAQVAGNLRTPRNTK